MINKKFIHVTHYESLLSKKLSADVNNTSYTLGIGGEIMEGEPDISYQSIVYIKDKKYIFTHGQLYDASGTSDKFKEAVKINGVDFDGSEDIVTEFWGASRDFNISDSTKKNQGESVSINGRGNVSLVLPKNIDANITNDSDGNNIVETYSTKKELTDALDELPTFLVYSSDNDITPTLNSSPAVDWITQETREQHGGDYYVTSSGRIFQFYEDPNTGWMWREITDYYLYECQESLKKIEDKVDMTEGWDQLQRKPETGDIYIKGELQSSQPYLDILCCNQNLNYRLDSETSIYLPFIYGGSWTRTRTKYLTRTSHFISINELSKAVGKTIIITNESTSAGDLTINLGSNTTGINITQVVSPGKICILKFCVSTVTGYICYYWESTLASSSVNWS